MIDLTTIIILGAVGFLILLILLILILQNQINMSQEIDFLRSNLQDAIAKQEVTNQKLDNIQADTTKLLDKLNNIPGIPQDVLDLAASINANAGSINDKATSIDDQVTDEPQDGE